MSWEKSSSSDTRKAGNCTRWNRFTRNGSCPTAKFNTPKANETFWLHSVIHFSTSSDSEGCRRRRDEGFLIVARQFPNEHGNILRWISWWRGLKRRFWRGKVDWERAGQVRCRWNCRRTTSAPSEGNRLQGFETGKRPVWCTRTRSPDWFWLSKILVNNPEDEYILWYSRIPAPEILKGIAYDQSVDWWVSGTMLYEMITGITP